MGQLPAICASHPQAIVGVFSHVFHTCGGGQQEQEQGHGREADSAAGAAPAPAAPGGFFIKPDAFRRFSRKLGSFSLGCVPRTSLAPSASAGAPEKEGQNGRLVADDGV